MNGKIRRKYLNPPILPRNEFVQKLDKEKLRSCRTGKGFSLIKYRLNGNGLSSQKNLVRILYRRMRSADEIGWIADDTICVFLSGSDAVGGEVFAVSVDEALYGYTNDNKKEYRASIEHFLPPTRVEKKKKIG